MPAPAAPPAPPLVRRSEWLGARAALAGQRSGRFALAATATFLVVLLALLIVPQVGGPARATTVVAARIDTAPLVLRADSARRAAAHADSQNTATLVTSEYLAGEPTGMTAAQRSSRDSLQVLASELDALVERAAKAPLPAAYRALAAATALRGDSRTGKLTDSLDALEKRREALAPTSGADLPFADITALVNDVGAAIRDAAVHRRGTLARSIADLETASSGNGAPIDTAGPRRVRDSTRAVVAAIDSALTSARAQNAAADQRATAARNQANRRVPPVAMLFAALVLAVIAGFSFNLSAEINHPTIATPREAERVAQAPILALARDKDRTPRVGGIDPFRMLYLGLTATGTRTRTVVISGDDRAVVATVAGRVALAAAADARATLVVDADAEGSSVAGYYLQRPEPGFSDAIAGVRLWREVTAPVGASDGLSIDVVPGGAIRRGDLDDVARDSAREEFARFRGEYDFCVVVAPPDAGMPLLCSLLEKPVTVLCAEVGRTSVARVRSDAARIRDAGAVLHGLALWEAELPQLPPRSELMSKTLAARVRRPIPEGE
jgi:Mrp family chromosome partitioning ATPase